jgi:hypothetical protein
MSTAIADEHDYAEDGAAPADHDYQKRNPGRGLF